MKNIRRIMAVIALILITMLMQVSAFAEESTDNVTIIREDITLNTNEIPTKTEIIIEREDIKIETPTFEKIPDTGSNNTAPLICILTAFAAFIVLIARSTIAVFISQLQNLKKYKRVG